jgi:hypothetical protein
MGLIKGRKYRFIGTKRPNYFADSGNMDFLLDGLHRVTEVIQRFPGCSQRYCFDNKPEDWFVKDGDFQLVTGERLTLKREYL